MVQINKKYKPLYSTKKRYTILTGGRGSGKTFAVEDFAVRLLEQVGQAVLYTRYTMVSVEKTIIPLFIKHIELISNINRYHITKTKITNKETKAFILFSGIKTSSGDQTANLKTLPDITTWIVEEGEDFNNEKSFVDIDDSIRHRTIQNRVLWIQNPTSKEHFIYKRFFEKHHITQPLKGAGFYFTPEGIKKKFTYQRCIHPNVEHIHTTYYDNKDNLNSDKVQQWEQAKIDSPLKWQNKYGGSWLDVAEGVIFENWKEGEFDNSIPYAYGQDFGFSQDATTLIRVAVDSKRKIIFVHEEFYAVKLNDTQLGTDAIYQINSSRIKEKNDLIVADSQEKRLIYDLKMKGLNIEECEKGSGSVKAGILAMQDFKIIVTPESQNIKKELKNYCWNDKKAGIPVDDYNHAIDAIRYAFKKLVDGHNPYILM